MAHLTHLDTHARTILKCFMSCFSTDKKAAFASTKLMHAVCFGHDRNATELTRKHNQQLSLLVHKVDVFKITFQKS